MRYRAIALILLAGTPSSPLRAGVTVWDFEGLPDRTSLTTQYPGVTFSGATVISVGISLNEFEFPPHSGSNVASDSGGPMTVRFASPVQSFSGYFTHSVPVTIQAFDAVGKLTASTTSRFSNNEGLSGISGSGTGEPLAVNTSVDIAKVVITGSPTGTSFTVDDINVAVFSQCDVNQDGIQNVSDVQRVINEALAVTPATDDLNLDGAVNVVDVQIVINAALGLGCGVE